LDNGELHDEESLVAAGVLPRNSLVRAWRTEPGDYRVPVYPAGVMWRRSLLLAVGGWLALYGMEDTGLLMAASAAAPGILLDTPTLRYRRHSAQRSRQDSNFGGGGRRLRWFGIAPPCWGPAIPGHPGRNEPAAGGADLSRRRGIRDPEPRSRSDSGDQWFSVV
jgi:hypothetical protein